MRYAAYYIFQPFGVNAKALMLLLKGNAATFQLLFMGEIKKPWKILGPIALNC